MWPIEPQRTEAAAGDIMAAMSTGSNVRPLHAARSTAPLVGVIMGSDSDLPVMSSAAEALEEFGVAHELQVVSAHRTPRAMLDYAEAAASAGLRIIIAGAGGAAHLPGMVASATVLPVIGVPIPLKHLDGMDSLLSIVQMPAGVPVATVGIGGARNAGLLAVRILSSGTDELGQRLRRKMVRYQESLAEMVAEKNSVLLNPSVG